MPVKKIQIRPGVNRENTRYTTEGGWYDCDKVRFRQGSAEKIGGWVQLSTEVFEGVCRSLWNWVTLGGQNLMGLGTSLKFYLERGGAYYDITPIRATTAAGDVTFSAIASSATLTVSDTAHGAQDNDFVTFSGAVSLGGNITAAVLNQEYQIQTVLDADSYTITATATANASDTGNGGASVVGAYQINTGNIVATPTTGFGAGTWGSGPWGTGGTTVVGLRVWSQRNFGEDLVFCPRGEAVYYWDASSGVTTRAVDISTLAGASSSPTVANVVFVSDIYRFVMCFGCNDYGSSSLDPMLIRWSDQEDAANWTPSATNQAGSLRLSSGSEIIAVTQGRQEILIHTDSALYGMQYLGYPDVWGAQLLGENISIASQNSVAYVGNIAFWMGKDKFYVYDGTVKPLPCNVRKYIFNDFNSEQYDQVFSGTNEGFHEVWWFYCSSGVTNVDRYVVYNYVQNIWYYGTMARTAWLDSGLKANPIAATYTYNLVNHEVGNDDKEVDINDPQPITAYVTSSEFDLDDGHQFTFIRRMLPDVTFDGSTADSPAINMSLLPMKNSGSGYNSPTSEGGVNNADVTRSATVPIEQFTGQVYVRVRGRQLAIKVESSALGVAWQLGSPRFDMRPDGRRG